MASGGLNKKKKEKKNVIGDFLYRLFRIAVCFSFLQNHRRFNGTNIIIFVQNNTKLTNQLFT